MNGGVKMSKSFAELLAEELGGDPEDYEFDGELPNPEDLEKYNAEEYYESK
jgi:hypothetical protein